MNELTFKSTKITPIIVNGQPYLGASQIATALQYKTVQRVIELFSRHSDEFTPEMAFLKDTSTKGGKQQVRVFSLRGCHLLAMFAKTPVAKEFRRWVLDLIETRDGKASALDAKAIGGIVKKCASKAVRDEIAALPAPTFDPNALICAIENEVKEHESHRCIGMAVSPQEKSLLEAIRNDYYTAVGRVYRAALNAVKQG